MRHNLSVALLILQWVLSLVILEESARFALSSTAAHQFARTGLPDYVRLALAGVEIVAAILFLIPRARVAGGWSLIVVLTFAIVLHFLHGWFDVGGLIVYMAATWAVMVGNETLAPGRT